MRIKKFGHSCLLIEEQSVKLLLDPGSFSHDLDAVAGLDGILITHQHADHVDLAMLRRLLEDNSMATVYTEAQTAAMLAKAGIEAQTVRDGDEVDIKGVRVEVIGKDHAVIARDIPVIGNIGFLIAGRFFYPGDALTVPPAAIEILALPAGAPWMRMEEAMDYLRTIKPKIAIPVHDGIFAQPGLFNSLFVGPAADAGSQLRSLDDGKAADF